MGLTTGEINKLKKLLTKIFDNEVHVIEKDISKFSIETPMCVTIYEKLIDSPKTFLERITTEEREYLTNKITKEITETTKQAMENIDISNSLGKLIVKI